MKASDIEKVKTFLQKDGDKFWQHQSDEPADSNVYLVDEILEIVNKNGFDLQLVETPITKEVSDRND